jgi:hypothetical protein
MSAHELIRLFMWAGVAVSCLLFVDVLLNGREW